MTTAAEHKAAKAREEQAAASAAAAEQAAKEQEQAKEEPRPAAAPAQAAPVIVSPDAYKAEQARQAQAEGLAKGLDRTVPGGRYKVGNRFVDANGDEIKD